ncbi:MXAN_6640 family putative metalloprotease [uncultured Nocardioides sp.]|uniref:MXAN_6640 family putative metalloprotease n=1 Tax=uncultured Nocardioides sp. TaxID=198441 RepID=UPI00260D7315|nr:MXAN_6640 family putative metalloprotease [uncultured Nocardioides sp.]
MQPTRALPAVLLSCLLTGLLAVGLVAGPASAAVPAQDPGPRTSMPLPELLAGLTAMADSDGDDVLRRARTAVQGATLERVDAPTLTLAELFTAYPRLDAEQREVADSLLARPTDRARDTYGDGYDRPEAEPLCGARICVHHVADGPDAPPDLAWVRRVRTVMARVWQHHVGELGYRAPAPDGDRGGSPGGRSRFDVYLADVGAQGYYGYCSPEKGRPGEERRASGYCVLDNDFAEFDGPPGRNLAVTAAHEFFHAVQFDYDVGEDRWFMEATAVWMEEQFAPGADDNRQYLPKGQLGRPGVSLDAFEPEGLAHYGNWLFFERLADTYGTDAVRRLWERVAAGRGDPDEYSVQALSRFLTENDSSLRSFLAVFSAGNLTPGRAYSEGAAYDASPVGLTKRLRAGGSTRFTTRLPHLSSRSAEVIPKPSPKRTPRVLRVSVRTPGAPVRTAARVVVHLADGRVQARPVKIGGNGRGKVQVPFSPRRVERVTVTLVNASARYDCWEGQPFACAGEPRYDDQVLSARFRAVG